MRRFVPPDVERPGHGNPRLARILAAATRDRQGMTGGVLIKVLALMVVLFLGTIFVQTHQQRSMKARVNYAITSAGPLRLALAEFLHRHGRLPVGSAELGLGERRDYPDGGYFHLVDQGHVEIRFTVLPELNTGAIHLTPRLAGVGSARGIKWDCRGIGGFPAMYLPPECKE